jgi:hypothetical protein
MVRRRVMIGPARQGPPLNVRSGETPRQRPSGLSRVRAVAVCTVRCVTGIVCYCVVVVAACVCCCACLLLCMSVAVHVCACSCVLLALCTSVPVDVGCCVPSGVVCTSQCSNQLPPPPDQSHRTSNGPQLGSPADPRLHRRCTVLYTPLGTHGALHSAAQCRCASPSHSHSGSQPFVSHYGAASAPASLELTRRPKAGL